MKRCAVWFLILALILALAGCGGEAEGPAPQPTEAPVTTAYVPTTPPTEAETYPLTGYVNASTLNVRPTPDTTGYAIGGLKYGDTVTIVGKEGDWYRISFLDDVGYVSAQYIQMDIPGSEPPTPTESTAEPTAEPTEAPTTVPAQTP